MSAEMKATGRVLVETYIDQHKDETVWVEMSLDDVCKAAAKLLEPEDKS